MLSNGLLSKGKESVLILEQKFSYLEQEQSRIGVIGTVDIADKETILLPHEMTIKKYVKYRKRAFERIQSQVEPVFITVAEKDLDSFLHNLVLDRNPDMSFVEPAGVLNEVYIIHESSILGDVQKKLRSSTGFVADGHHRLQALKEINKKRLSEGKYQYSLFSYVTSLYSESLLISGIHRIVTGGERENERTKLGRYFTVSEPMERFSGYKMGIYNGEFREIKPTSISSNLINNKGISDALNVDYSDLLILPHIFSIDPETIGKEVTYTPSQQEAIEMVKSGKGGTAILIPPLDKKQFMDVITSGRILGPKSTFFFPKIPAGIAIYKMG